MISVVGRVREKCDADLAKVGGTRDAPSLLTGGVKRRQQHRREKTDDGDYHQQFDEGESGKLARFGWLHWGFSRSKLFIHPRGNYVNQ